MNSGASNKYDVMSIEDMKALPINKISADNSLLAMWWVDSMPLEAIELVKAWGFRLVKMNGFLWIKKTKSGKDHFGMGHYTRAGSESVIFAIKGKTKEVIQARNVRAVQHHDEIINIHPVEHEILRHSEKPKIFADLLVELCGNVPRIELFARDKKEGWEVWGNEVLEGINLDDNQLNTFK